MAKDIRGKGLAIASRFAGSQFAEKHGLRKPAERFAYLATKAGFQVAGKFMAKKAKKPHAAPEPCDEGQAKPKIVSDSYAKGIFDLSLTEEQQMIVDATRTFVENELFPHELAIERSGHLPLELIKEIQKKAIEAGLYAANMPTDRVIQVFDAQGTRLMAENPTADLSRLQVGRLARVRSGAGRVYVLDPEASRVWELER